eukprot:jgi/Mesen1/3057/ME000018S02370
MPRCANGRAQDDITELYSSTFGGVSVSATSGGAGSEPRVFGEMDEKLWGELGRSEPLVLKALIGAVEKQRWQAFQKRIHELALTRNRMRRLLASGVRKKLALTSRAAAPVGLSTVSGEGGRAILPAPDVSGGDCFDGQELKLLKKELEEAMAVVDEPVAEAGAGDDSAGGDEEEPSRAAAGGKEASIVLISGFESFNVALYKEAAAEIRSRCPGVRVSVFSDRDISSKRKEELLSATSHPLKEKLACACVRAQVEAALAQADAFFGSLLFDYDQCEWLKERVGAIPTRLVFESSLELMATTNLGSFQMSGGKSKGMPPAVKAVLSKFGGGREEDRMVGYLSFLKIGPKLLRFIPGKKVRDLRNWLTIYGFWNQASSKLAPPAAPAQLHATTACSWCLVVAVGVNAAVDSRGECSGSSLEDVASTRDTPPHEVAPSESAPRARPEPELWHGACGVGGKDNVVSMFLYLADEYLVKTGLPTGVLQETPPLGLYHPDHAGYFTSPAAYMRWHASATKRSLPPNAPVVAVLLYRKHVITGQPYIPAMLRLFERDGLRPLPIFINGVEAHTVVRDLLTSRFEQEERRRGNAAISSLTRDAVHVDAIVSTIGFPLVGGPAGTMEGGRQAEVAKSILAAKNVPYMVAAPLLIQDITSWQRNGIQGLQSVVLYSLPELDGAIDAVPLGGLVPERVRKLTARLQAWIKLRRTPAAQRKVAIVLYGFPPGVGATGTAALLNVPKSLEKLLQRLRAEGYLAHLPDDINGEDLLTMLKALDEDAVVSAGAQGGPSQALAIAQGKLEGEGRELPLAQMRAEAVDWRTLSGWLGYNHISSVCLASSLSPVGCMRARGRAGMATVQLNGWQLYGCAMLLAACVRTNLRYNMPAAAAAAAAGAWLLARRQTLTGRMEKMWGELAKYKGIRCDAAGNSVVSGLQIGNVWSVHHCPLLPMACSWLSWSDVLMGTLPNMYVYAANNPSESIVAKRRGYATIVSYNVPPYGRAGLYKELASLRELISEYREAPETNQALRQVIAGALLTSGMHADCPFREASEGQPAVTLTADSVDAVDLHEFDAYMVRLYEYLSVVENRLFSEGLHTLGQAPSPDQMEQYLSAYFNDDVPQAAVEAVARTSGGLAEEEGVDVPTARIFSNPAGDYGSMVNERVGAADWESGTELGETWQSRNSFSYGRGESGVARPEVLQKLLRTTDRIVQEIDSVEYGLTDIQEYYANTGAMQNAAQSARDGKKVACSVIETYGKDLTPRDLEATLRLEYRSKLLNPKWAEKMAAQGSGGAYEISQRMTALVGWGGTAGFQEDWVYDQAAETYALDEGMAALLRKNNPQAPGRGMWKADPDLLSKLRDIYGELDDELEGVKKPL